MTDLVPGGIWYDFTQLSEDGQTLPDQSASGIDGTIGRKPYAGSNDPVSTAQGLFFGGNQYVRVPDLNDYLAGATGCTVMVVAFNSGGGTYNGLLGQETTTLADRTIMLLDRNAAFGGSDAISFGVHGDTLAAEAIAVGRVAGLFQCITGRFIGGTSVEIRKNLGAWTTTTTDVPAAINTAPASTACFGRYADNHLTGGIAYALVYPFALTDEQVAQNYAYLDEQSALGAVGTTTTIPEWPTPADLVPGGIWYDFTQLSTDGQTVPDSTGNYPGALGSQPGVDINDPAATAQGLYFNGSHYVRIPDLNDCLAGATELTVMCVAWATPSISYTGVVGRYNADLTDRTFGIVDAYAGTTNNNILFSVGNESAAASALIPGRLNATLQCVVGRFVGGTSVEIRKNLGDWVTTTAGVPAALSAAPGPVTTIGRNLANYFTGGIACLLVYPSALTDQQIDENYFWLAAHTALGETGIAADLPAPAWEPPVVLFTFDDGWTSTYTGAFPVFEAAGLPATVYINSGATYQDGKMTLGQMQAMYAAGWDIGNHTATHPTPLSGLTRAQQEAEFSACAAFLEENDMPRGARHVAYPSNSYNADTLAAMADAGMLTGRTTSPTEMAIRPEIRLYELQGGVGLEGTVAAMTAQIDAAKPGEIIIYIGHKTTPEPESLSWTTANLAELVAYVAAKGCQVMTITQLWQYLLDLASSAHTTFSFSPATPYAGQEIVFTDTSANDTTSWLWSFGDGETSEQQNPTHQFAAGTHAVTLTTGWGTATATVTVLPIPSVHRRTPDEDAAYWAEQFATIAET